MDDDPEAMRDGLATEAQRIDRRIDELASAHERADDDLLAAYRDLELALQNHMETEETTIVPQIQRRSPRDARLLLEEHRYLRHRLVEVGLALSARVLRDLRQEVAAHERTESKILARWLDGPRG